MASIISRRSTRDSAIWLLSTMYSFTKTDIYNLVLPACTLCAVIHAYYAVSSITTMLYSVLKTFIWGYLGLLCIDISNQLMGVEEDRLNKPFRPLVTGRISIRGAMRLLVIAEFLFVLVAQRMGVLWSALSFIAATSVYNFTGADQHWVGKNMCNAWGYGCYFSAGAWIAYYDITANVTTLNIPTEAIDTMPAFICALVILNILNIFFTITIQDLRDVDGDLKSHRITHNLAWGEYPARVYTAIMMLLGTLVQITGIWRMWGSTLAALSFDLMPQLSTIGHHSSPLTRSVSATSIGYYSTQFLLVAWVGARIISHTPSYTIVTTKSGEQITLLNEARFAPLWEKNASDKGKNKEKNKGNNHNVGLTLKLDDIQTQELEHIMLDLKRRQYDHDDKSFKIYIIWLYLYTFGPLF